MCLPNSLSVILWQVLATLVEDYEGGGGGGGDLDLRRIFNNSYKEEDRGGEDRGGEEDRRGGKGREEKPK